MNHTRLWVVASILAFIIFAGFLLSAPHTRDIVEVSAPHATTSVPTVALHDSFKKGVHTITGAVSAPDACTAVTAQATPVGTASSTDSILVVVSMPLDSGICLKRSTSIHFSTTIAAPAGLPITATVNSAAATTTAL